MSRPDWHRISAIDEKSKRGVCSICGPVSLRRRVRRGKVEWSCGLRHSQLTSKSLTPPHRRNVAGACTACAFVARHRSQFDVHHINGDHSDNRPENLVTLCANCHRLLHAIGADEFAKTNPAWAWLCGRMGWPGGMAADDIEFPRVELPDPDELREAVGRNAFWAAQLGQEAA